VLLSRVGVGIGVAAMLTLQFADIAKGVDPEERGQLMGVATALTHVGNLAGFLLGGVLATWWTESGNFALGAAAYAAIMAAALHVELRARQTPKEPVALRAPDWSRAEA